MQQPDPYHFYGGPPRHQQPHFDQPRPGFPPFQQGFGPPRPGPPGQEGPGMLQILGIFNYYHFFFNKLLNVVCI